MLQYDITISNCSKFPILVAFIFEVVVTLNEAVLKVLKTERNTPFLAHWDELTLV